MERATAEFDLHGLAAVRLVDADERDLAAVARQLGPLPRRIEREPDIVVRFVDRIEHASRLRYLGAREAGWTDDAFFVLRSRKQPVRTYSATFSRHSSGVPDAVIICTMS